MEIFLNSELTPANCDEKFDIKQMVRNNNLIHKLSNNSLSKHYNKKLISKVKTG